MKAALLLEPETFSLTDVPMPVPNQDEVLIKILYCGVCKSELELWKNPSKYKVVKNAGYPGHEILGEIEENGHVAGLNKGDTVAVIQFPGTGYAQYVAVNKDYVLPVPPKAREQVYLGEPLSCALNGLRKLPFKAGDKILLIGHGFIGSIILKLLKELYPVFTIVSDTRESARKRAKESGADVVINPLEENLPAHIKKMTNNSGVDVVIEAVGSQKALDIATNTVKNSGTIAIFGFHNNGIRMVNMEKWNWKGLTIINAHERDEKVYFEGMKKAINLLNHDIFQFNLVSHVYPLHQINEAFRLMDQTPEEYVKSVINPWMP